MAITGKPQKPTSPPPVRQPSEDEVRSLILRGGSVPESSRTSDAPAVKPQLVQLRLYADFIEDIDTVRQATAGKKRPLSRHAWIVRAIEEKLERDRR